MLYIKQATLPCQIETPGVLLGLVVAYPPRFFDSDVFFILDPWGFYSDRGFSKLMDDAAIVAEVLWN